MSAVTHLVVAKAPVPGLAKTRLTAAVSPHQAADLAAAALLDTLDAVVLAQAAAGGRPVVALTGDLGAAVRRDELQASLRSFVVVPQRGPDLAARLAAAHSDAAEVGGGAVVQIGMDTPQVSAALLSRAGELIVRGDHDALLGGAPDGGWWVLATAAPHWAAALTGVAMSRADTGDRTRAALLAAGARTGELGELQDVDLWADALAVASAHPYGRFGRAVAAVRAEVPRAVAS